VLAVKSADVGVHDTVTAASLRVAATPGTMCARGALTRGQRGKNDERRDA